MDFIKSQFTRLPLLTPVNLTPCTVLITGANAGLGYETAKEILASRPARLILAVRSLERGKRAASELAKLKESNTEIDVRQLDQAKFSSVKDFVDGLQGQKIDIAILNAGRANASSEEPWLVAHTNTGTWSFKWEQTVDGYESDIAVNVLGPALLSLLLLPNLRRAVSSRSSNSDVPPPHLTFVSSGLHAMAKFPERKLASGNVLSTLNDPRKYDGTDRYATSKLISLLWTKELAKRTEGEGIVINAPNPGFCKTGILGNSAGTMKWVMKASEKLVGRSPVDGGRCIVDGATIKGTESHGRYLSEMKVANEVEYARSESGLVLQKKMWNEVIDIFKIKGVLPSNPVVKVD